MDSDRYVNNIYIPKDTLLELIDKFDIGQIERFFTTNKELYTFINSPSVLKYISDKKHLPYVSSFSNLIYFDSMDKDLLLKEALEIGDLRIVKHYVTNYEKALEIAIKYGHIDIVKYLYRKIIDNGGKISTNAVNKAAYYGHLNIVKYLHENGYDSKYAILDAIRNEHIDIVKYLVENGDGISEYAINEAIRYGYLDIVKYFIENTDKTLTISKSLIENAARNGYFNIVKYLVEGLYRPSTISGINTTNLHRKMRNGSYASEAVENGGEISEDAIEQAAIHGYIDIVKYLVKHINVSNIKEDTLSRIIEYIDRYSKSSDAKYYYPDEEW